MVLKENYFEIVFPSRLSKFNPLLHLTTWPFIEASLSQRLLQTIATDKTQRVGEASPDTIMFKPVAARSLFASSSSISPAI